MNAGAARFDRFDSLLGSIGTRCTCLRDADGDEEKRPRRPKSPEEGAARRKSSRALTGPSREVLLS
eukprot:3862920-Alexandrium_andersonii.AAC.1